MSLSADYFDRMYAADPDPWGFAERWYEQRKYALTLAALPRPRFASALEIGCSIGVLTAKLAGRCDALLALDPSGTALEAARTRAPDARFLQACVPGGWPAGRYDLVVLSEVAYYLSAEDLTQLLELVERDLTEDGVVLACHWRHEVGDYPLRGDDVHRALTRWPRSSRVEEADFLLDVLHPGGRTDSVAAREGLA